MTSTLDPPTDSAIVYNSPSSLGRAKSSSLPSRMAACRILSETAHDLRSPLTSVRESIRLVSSGNLGEINSDQNACLVAAIDVCDSMERLVADMLQIERLQAGRSRPRRSWFSLDTIRQTVTSSLDSLLRPRQISIVWIGFEASASLVFGDADKITRLLSNLISNAVRETGERQSVIARAMLSADQQSMIVSVIDSGQGLKAADWARVFQRGASDHGSEGLGLAICRQLTAAHFSPLTILSRVGRGTEVSFELPVAGPTAVANQWAHWRSLQRERVTPRRVSRIDYDSSLLKDPHRVFEDGETRLLMFHNDGPLPQVPETAMLLTVSAGATVARKAVEGFDEKLQRAQRSFDLVYRASDRRWVVVWDLLQENIADRIDSLSGSNGNSEDGNLRLTWSDARPLAIGTRQTAMVLVDTITRESFCDREPVGFYDDDMSSDGSNDFSRSMVPEERLRDELSRLSVRLNARSEQLHRQAKKLR